MDKLTFENVKILWKNFSGEERQFNPKGNRNFSILIEDLDYGKELSRMGWAVRPLTNRETEEQEAWHLPVKLSYKNYPPRIYKVTSGRPPLLLSEKSVDMLDLLPIDYVDITINPYEWTRQGDSGVKAYVDVMYVVIEQSELDLKWQSFEEEGAVFTEDEL